METTRAGCPTAVLSGAPDDPTQVVTPAARPRQSHGLLDGEKTGAVLLFSGALLILTGATFTATGWHHYRASPKFEWTQLLGPVLISVGGTFLLTSVCKFGTTSCSPCRQWDKEVLVTPAMEQTSTGHSFTLSGINRPMVFHNGSAMLRIPPQYNLITQEGRQAVGFQSASSVNGVRAACPPHDAVCRAVNGAFTAAEEEEEDDGSARCTETDRRRRRFEKRMW